MLIDTPELNQTPYGRAARAFLLAHVRVGSAVTLETDVQELWERSGFECLPVDRRGGRC